MARIRTIKPEFFASPKSARVTRDARLFFAGLLTEADDEGRLLASSKRLAGCLFPYDDDVTNELVDTWILELEDAGLIQAYDVGTTRYLFVIGFTEHQRVSHPTASKHPAPPAKRSRKIPEDSRKPPENFVGERKGKEGKGKESLAPVAHPGRKTDPLWDAVMDACGVKSDDLTKSARGGYNKAVSELRNVGAQPADIPTRARNYRRAYPNAALTPTALAKHWAALANTTSTADTPGAGLPKPLTDAELAALEGRTA